MSIQVINAFLLATSAPTPTISAHRYWRFNIMGSSGATTTYVVGEVEMRESVGGADVTGSGTASASSGVTNPAAGAFANDGETTKWQSANGIGTNGHWLKYDFGVGVTKAIVEVGIMGVDGGTFLLTQCIGAFVVEYSDDDATWLPAWIVLYPGGNNAHGYVDSTFKTFTMPVVPASTQYWMQAITGSNGGSFVGAAEVEWRESTGGVDATGSGTATSRSFTATREVIRAFDNNTANEWASGNKGFPEWLVYDFGSGKTITEISYLPRAAGNTASQSPTGFYVCNSSDGISYAPIGWSVTGIASWVSGTPKVFTKP